MPTSVIMPALELAQETGKVVAWRKQEGELVRKGEPLLDVETDKAVVEVESPGDGVLAGVAAQVGDDVVVGRIIGWLLGPGETVPPPEAPTVTGRTGSGPTPSQSAAQRAAALPVPSSRQTGGVRISPKARRLAQDAGIDLRALKGTGPGGEILASDVEAAAAAANRTVAAEAQAYEPVGTIWKLMADRTVQSWTTVPHFFLAREVDASALVEARAELKGAGVTYTDLLIALAARTLVRHPRVNASWTAQGIRRNAQINIGVAVATDDGVSVAVVSGAATASVETVAAERQALAERARAGKSRPTDVSGATFTISNLGMHRVDAFTAVINPPQAAILAVGSVVDRVVPIDGAPAVRPTLTMTLSSDHRVVDGARAAAFMDDLAAAIGDPFTWLK